MSKETKPTPLLLPLRVALYEKEGLYDVLEANGLLICAVADEGHAAFIVRACNSHEALVEACKALLENCEVEGIGGDSIRRAEAVLAQAVFSQSALGGRNRQRPSGSSGHG